MTPEEGLLSVERVIRIHDRAIRDYGGAPGLRDPGGLESAVVAAKNVFYYGQGDMFEVAAAYAYHIAESQAFMDGNKRTGLGSALRYLLTQGHVVPLPPEFLDKMMVAIGTKVLSRADVATILRVAAVPMPFPGP